MRITRIWLLKCGAIVVCALAFTSPTVLAQQAPIINVSDSQPSVFEGNPGGPGTTAVFKVKLSAVPAEDVTFLFSTSEVNGFGTAAISGTSCATADHVNGADFIGITNKLVTIPAKANPPQVDVPVTICPDTVVEEHQVGSGGAFTNVELFDVLLTNVTNAVCDAASCLSKGFIVDDDGPPIASINNATLREPLQGTAPMTFTVSLSHPHPGFDVKVNFATRPNTASGSPASLPGIATCGDYISVSGQLDFPPGVMTNTFDVPICADTAQEPTETFFADVTGGQNMTIGVNGVGTIINFILPTFGTFEVNPIGADAKVDEWIPYQFEWTVSTGVWRDLDTLEFRVRERDGKAVPLWIKWTEHTNTFQVCERGRKDGDGEDDEDETPAQITCGPAVVAGTPGILRGRHGSLDVGASKAIGSGPTGPSVTLDLAVRFDRAAGNKTYDVEVAALSDSGIRDNFMVGGSLVVHR